MLPTPVVMSPTTKLLVASLKINVIVAVSPIFTVATLRVINSVGASVSMA